MFLLKSLKFINSTFIFSFFNLCSVFFLSSINFAVCSSNPCRRSTVCSFLSTFFGLTFYVSLLFFFFFRSLRATLISMGVVIIGVMWAFGILGLLQYEITVLTALIPPLMTRSTLSQQVAELRLTRQGSSFLAA